MYERLVLFYTNLDGYDIYRPFYYRGTKKQSAKEKDAYDFFNIALETKMSDITYTFIFQNNNFYTEDYFSYGRQYDYSGPEFMTLEEYFESVRIKMSDEEEKMLKRELKIQQVIDNH